MITHSVHFLLLLVLRSTKCWNYLPKLFMKEAGATDTIPFRVILSKLPAPLPDLCWVSRRAPYRLDGTRLVDIVSANVCTHAVSSCVDCYTCTELGQAAREHSLYLYSPQGPNLVGDSIWVQMADGASTHNVTREVSRQDL